MLPSIHPFETQAWRKLTAHFLEMQALSLREEFAADPQRFDKFHTVFEDIVVDFSKNCIAAETIGLFNELASECGLSEAIDAMYQGHTINQTEGRAVLHIALRNRSNRPVMVNGEDVMPEINRVLEQMKNFSSRLLSGEWKDFRGKPSPTS